MLDAIFIGAYSELSKPSDENNQIRNQNIIKINFIFLLLIN